MEKCEALPKQAGIMELHRGSQTLRGEYHHTEHECRGLGAWSMKVREVPCHSGGKLCRLSSLDGTLHWPKVASKPGKIPVCSRGVAQERQRPATAATKTMFGMTRVTISTSTNT